MYLSSFFGCFFFSCDVFLGQSLAQCGGEKRKVLVDIGKGEKKKGFALAGKCSDCERKRES